MLSVCLCNIVCVLYWKYFLFTFLDMFYSLLRNVDLAKLDEQLEVNVQACSLK